MHGTYVHVVSDVLSWAAMCLCAHEPDLAAVHDLQDLSYVSVYLAENPDSSAVAGHQQNARACLHVHSKPFIYLGTSHRAITVQHVSLNKAVSQVPVQASQHK